MKYKEEEALANEALIIESMRIPGNTKEMYGTPAIDSIREPMTVPKMKIYNAAEITGATSV
jgi:hypothetical protein